MVPFSSESYFEKIASISSSATDSSVKREKKMRWLLYKKHAADGSTYHENRGEKLSSTKK
jgi:hypothetical protein